MLFKGLSLVLLFFLAWQDYDKCPPETANIKEFSLGNDVLKGAVSEEVEKVSAGRKWQDASHPRSVPVPTPTEKGLEGMAKLPADRAAGTSLSA